MNWNGKQRNGVLANVSACREAINTTKQRGSSSEAAGWLLNPIDPDNITLISLVVPLNQWTEALSDTDRTDWLLWAMKEYPIEVRLWMGYTPDWTMMPAAVSKRFKEVVRLGHKLPDVYLLPGEPRQKDGVDIIVLDTGLRMEGIKLATVTYVVRKGIWYKVYYPKLPSKSAVSRAIRLYLLGVLLGRKISTAKELMMYEVTALKQWLLYDTLVDGIAEHAGDTLFHILTTPEIVGQIP